MKPYLTENRTIKVKKAIIIGASSGIGKELALILAKNDFKVGITGRRTELLEEIKTFIPENFSVKTLDITVTENIPATLKELTEELDGLDLIIISAGTGDLNEALDFSIEKMTINTNVSGFTAVADWAFNYFKEKKAGHLVAISSVAGLRGNRWAPAYNASKAYQINYLEGLRQKAKSMKLPVAITDIRPGFVDTAMAKGDGKFWVASPSKAAKQVHSAIRRKKKVAYVTKRYLILAFLLKILPRSIYDKI
jgi:short-subunit dehydrogenase